MSLKDKAPKVSIVIPTYNSAQTLPLCLESVRNQTYRNIEVIVVDAFSGDGTVEMSERFGAQVVLQRSNQAEARNAGVAESEGEYVLFLDSDQVLSASLVEECVEKCLNEKVEMVRVPEVFVGKGYWSVCSAVWKNRYEAVEHVYGGRSVLMHGEPRFFVKRRVEEFGTFDAALVWGEDFELYERLRGAKIREGFCTSVLYHREEASLRQMFLKNLRYGESMPTFVKQAKRLPFPSMLRHALLVFAEIVKKPPRLDLVVGCFLLFAVKSSSTLIGVLRGAGR